MSRRAVSSTCGIGVAMRKEHLESPAWPRAGKEIQMRSSFSALCHGAGPVGTVTALLLVVVLGLMVLCCGCGSSKQDVVDYLDMSGGLVDDLDSKCTEVKNYFPWPLADQGEVKNKLREFRKAITEARSEVDRIDAPEPCRQLSDNLRHLIARGQSFANSLTQYSDYVASMAPVARQVEEMAGVLLQLEESQDIPSGFVGLVARLDKINSDYNAVIAPAELGEVHAAFGDFLQSVNEDFASAKKKIGYGGQEPESSAPQTAPDYDSDTATQRDTRVSKEHKAVAPLLEGIPAQWAEFNQVLTTMLGRVLTDNGSVATDAGFVMLRDEIRAQLDELKKEYERK